MEYISLFLLTFQLLLPQEKTSTFEDKNFHISYTVITHQDNQYLQGRIVELKSKEPVTGVNIWAACKNSDGSTSGTVPDEDGAFKLNFPKTCKTVFFLKYGYDKIELKINLK
jgi:hypothetical protein